MTREELENAIENCKCVYLIINKHKGYDTILEITLNPKYFIENRYSIDGIKGAALFYDNELNGSYDYICDIDILYKTKAEAEHYLHHANVERVEKLPFLTWEEFKENKTFEFVNNEGVVYELCIGEEKLQDKILLYEGVMLFYTWDLTEANFYKAYDECKKLFLEAEDE